MGLPWLCSDSSDTAAAKRVWACMSLYVTFRIVRRFRAGTKWCEDVQRVIAAAAKVPKAGPTSLPLTGWHCGGASRCNVDPAAPPSNEGHKCKRDGRCAATTNWKSGTQSAVGAIGVRMLIAGRMRTAETPPRPPRRAEPVMQGHRHRARYWQ